jgi:hypothetical protein
LRISALLKIVHYTQFKQVFGPDSPP